MRALSTTEFCVFYNISRKSLERLVECGLVFRLGIPGKTARYRDPGAEFMQRILDRQAFCRHAPLLGVADLARYFGISRKTVQRWVSRGKLHSTFRDNQHWFAIEDLENFLRSHRTIRRTLAQRVLNEQLGPAPPRNLSFKEQALLKAPVLAGPQPN